MADKAPSLETTPESSGVTDANTMSIFDYLGTLVEAEQGWIDPLVLHEDDAAIEAERQAARSQHDEDPAAKSHEDIEVSQ